MRDLMQSLNAGRHLQTTPPQPYLDGIRRVFLRRPPGEIAVPCRAEPLCKSARRAGPIAADAQSTEL
jgi:hypothetical protein